MNRMETEINIITEKVIGVAYTFSNKLGAGFQEKDDLWIVISVCISVYLWIL